MREINFIDESAKSIKTKKRQIAELNKSVKKARYHISKLEKEIHMISADTVMRLYHGRLKSGVESLKERNGQ